jgi:hypothetical protein
LPLELANGGKHQWFSLELAGVVEQVLGGKIVGCIHNNIILIDIVENIAFADSIDEVFY